MTIEENNRILINIALALDQYENRIITEYNILIYDSFTTKNKINKTVLVKAK